MNQYKLVMHQPTGFLAETTIKLWDETRLDDAIAMHVDSYCIAYSYDGPVYVSLFQRKPDSFASTKIREEVYS